MDVGGRRLMGDNKRFNILCSVKVYIADETKMKGKKYQHITLFLVQSVSSLFALHSLPVTNQTFSELLCRCII